MDYCRECSASNTLPLTPVYEVVGQYNKIEINTFEVLPYKRSIDR